MVEPLTIPWIEVTIRPIDQEWLRYDMTIRTYLPRLAPGLQRSFLERSLKVFLECHVRDSVGPHQIHSYTCSIESVDGKVLESKWDYNPSIAIRNAAKSVVAKMYREIQRWYQPKKLATPGSWNVSVLITDQ